MLRLAVGVVIRHHAPAARAFGTGIFRSRIKIRQAEDVAVLVADHADVRHVFPAFGDDDIGPDFASDADAPTMRPQHAAAIGTGEALACVDDFQRVEILQRIRAVARFDGADDLAEHRAANLADAPLIEILAVLLRCDPIEDFALDAQLAARGFVVVIGHAAEGFLAGGIGRVVAVAAEEKILPFLERDFGAVLHIGELD